MAMMRLAVLFLLVCFLAGVSCGLENGPKDSKGKKPLKEKTKLDYNSANGRQQKRAAQTTQDQTKDDQEYPDWTKYSGSSYNDWPKYSGDPYSDLSKYYGGSPSNWSTLFGGSSADWSKYWGGNYPSSLGAGVSWGPFIPLASSRCMPIPDPYYYPYGYWSGKGKGADYSKGKGTSQGSQEAE